MFNFANLALKDSLASFCICVAEAEQPERLLVLQNQKRKEGKQELEAQAQLCWTNEASGLADLVQLLKCGCGQLCC